VSYIVAILSLGGLCILWYWIQRWSGETDARTCGHGVADCADCEYRSSDSSEKPPEASR
jgi:hypothetical protein